MRSTARFHTQDDVADYAADVALDSAAPRFWRIAGDLVSARDLAATMTRLSGHRYALLCADGIGRLDLVIRVARALSPRTDAPFPASQGMQFRRDMSSGRGKVSPLARRRGAWPHDQILSIKIVSWPLPSNPSRGDSAWHVAEDVPAVFAPNRTSRLGRRAALGGSERMA